MSQSAEPITTDDVADELQDFLETIAEDGDSELGVFAVRRRRDPSKENESCLILVLDTEDGEKEFLLTIRPA